MGFGLDFWSIGRGVESLKLSLNWGLGFLNLRLFVLLDRRLKFWYIQ